MEHVDERGREIDVLRDRLSRCSPTIRGVAAPSRGESRAQHLLLRTHNYKSPKNRTSAAVCSIVGYVNTTSVGGNRLVNSRVGFAPRGIAAFQPDIG